MLKVGETIKYDLVIVGEPVPEASWTANDKAIKHGGRCKMITEHGKHLLKVFEIQFLSAGLYLIDMQKLSI